MDIALIADDTKKELMTQFCIAYCGILSKHHICATSITGSHGGAQQITSRISYNEIDVLLYFRSTTPNREFDENEHNLFRMCDVHNVPMATNIATAEVLICALDHGDLDWREIVNPRSDYNRRRRGLTY